MDGGDSCVTLCAHLILLNCILKMVEMANFMLFVFSHNKNDGKIQIKDRCAEWVRIYFGALKGTGWMWKGFLPAVPAPSPENSGKNLCPHPIMSSGSALHTSVILWKPDSFSTLFTMCSGL